MLLLSRKHFIVVIFVGVLLAVVTVYCRVFSDRAVFQNITGLDLPRSAIVIQSTSTEAGAFGSDTYRCLVLKVDAETIRKWLIVNPLNGAANWKNGPVGEPVLRAEDTIPDSVLDSADINYALYAYREGR
jgi:hypothetical protein